jgi:sulfatase modifying factor 1
MGFKFFLVSTVLVLLGFNGRSQKTGELVGVSKPLDFQKEKIPAALKPFYKDMVYVPSGSFKSGKDPVDTSRREMMVTVTGFYISAKEVSNAQYRIFYEEMVKEKSREQALEYYPVYDVMEIPYGPNGFFMNDSMYFSHPAYDDYPVIGVSWKQANAYCEWISKKVIALVDANPAWKIKYPMANFRLPTEMEWEYAAYGNKPQEITNQDAMSGKKQNVFSFGPSLFSYNKSGIYNANFGTIKDEKGLVIKSASDDGFFFTGNVKSYSPNGYGLYNMSGNVNEWVLDVYRKNDNHYDFKRDISPEYRQYDPEKENAKDSHVIKGGGFLDTPYYLLVSSRRELDPTKGKCDVGFRICMTYIGN